MDKKMLNEFRRLSGIELITESTNYKEVAQEINNSILKIDENLDVENFALAVGEILKEEYGSHNYKTFKKTLNEVLGSSKDWLDLESHPYEEINDKPINENNLNESDDYRGMANVVATKLVHDPSYNGTSDELYNFIINNEKLIKDMGNKISDIVTKYPEIMILLAQHPKELQKLINN